MSLVGYLLLILGAMVLLLAAVGLFVLEDALSRQHAGTKAGSLGVLFCMIGTALVGGDWMWAWRCMLVILLVWLTLPVASHVLARAAVREQGVVEPEGYKNRPFPRY